VVNRAAALWLLTAVRCKVSQLAHESYRAGMPTMTPRFGSLSNLPPWSIPRTPIAVQFKESQGLLG